MAAEGGGLELAVIPPGIFGPVLGTHFSASVALVKAMLEGTLPVVLPRNFDVADVRDVAQATLRAVTEPAAAGERFLVGSGTPTSFLRMARVLAEGLGERAAKVPARELTPEEVREGTRTDPALREAASRLGEMPVLRTDKARAVLGWEPRSVRTTVLETAESLFRLGLVEA
ncbi:hypothetical protein ACFYWP_27465 [Actinacidiphila glaucinigra]|uniref:hypothetical protein n=1 Tax=Actinacidiphila glaucinigra TaxID=235986 RepID=UPI0036AC1546